MTPHGDQSLASLLQGCSSVDWNSVRNVLSKNAPQTAFLASILPLNPPVDFVDWFLDTYPDQISEYAQRKSPLESCFAVLYQEELLQRIARATAQYNERGVWFKSRESIFQLLPESYIRILLDELPQMMRPLILSYLMDNNDDEGWHDADWSNLKLVLEWLAEQNDDHDLVHSERDNLLYGHVYLATLLPSLERWRDSVDSIVSCLVFIQKRHKQQLLVAQNKQGWTLLHFLLVQLHPDRLFRDQVKFSTRCLDPLLDLLATEQACWTTTMDGGDVPLHVALENNVSFVIPRLVQAAPLTLERKGSQGMFPFQLACLHLTSDDDDDDTFVVTQLYTLLRQAPHLVLFNNNNNNNKSCCFFVDSDMALQVARQDMELARLSRRRRAHEAHQRQVNLQMRRNMKELAGAKNTSV